MQRRKSTQKLVLTALLTASTTAWASPPFRTDDPGTLPYHHGEAYLFSTGTHAAGGTTLDAAPGVELNYSFLRDTFAHLVVPLASSSPANGPSAYGLGDVELGFKWRMIRQSKHAPDMGIFPLIEIPTGNATRGLGNGYAQYFLPLWLQKDWGPWTSYGGGGYWINPGYGNQNWWFSGVLLQRQLSPTLYLGGEVFHTTPDTVNGRSATAFSVGGSYAIVDYYQILFSAGRNVTDVNANRFSYYLGLYRSL